MPGTKVLFFAEGATLAHVARPLVLAKSLDPFRFKVVFARPPAFQWMTSGLPLKVVDLACQDSSVFAQRLERGLPLYDFKTLLRYVEDDLALIDSEKPDIIVGDFRLSLSVSARLRSIPYITICDAYWSSTRRLDPPLPVLGLTQHVPLSLMEPLFRIASPIAFKFHAIAMERLRAEYRLPSFGFNLQRCYTDADLQLFANIPSLFPEIQTSATAKFIGPIAWSPNSDSNEFGFLDSCDPVIYVTMGSSGDPRVLNIVIPALERLGGPVVVATAGRFQPDMASAQTRIFDFVPGDLVCKHARLVVCNGGSPSTNQALTYGVPVLGIAKNMDQFLNMRAIENIGAGITLRADRVTAAKFTAAATELITNKKISASARVLAESARIALAGNSLDVFIDNLLCK